ncbi:ankyrin-repeat and fibronectin type III domain-containing 1-like isoform X2 [Artemia franciscana]
MEKLNKINIHLQALFAAVENGQVERCRVIAQSSDCDINSPNALGLTLLDVAVLLRNNQMAKMLRNEFGAQEGVKYKNRQDLLDHLGQMELTTNQSLDVLSKSVLIGQNNNQLATGKNNEKEISIWKRRAKMIQLFKEGVEKLRPPPPPDLVDVEVVKSGSVRILFKEIPAIEPSLVSTKLKVQWSTSPGFLNIDGELEIRNPKETQVNIENLDPGQRYFIRACSGNLVGYGDWMTAHPPFVVPSTWRDVDSKKERFEGRSTVFDEIFSEIKSIRSDSELIYDSYDGAAKSKKNTTKSLFQFFAGTPKFQKSLKRGVYLSCILYQDEKVLVTAEDALPVVEVDDGYPASFNTDFHWLMKVGCTWSDVKYLRQAMEKSLSSSTIHFRIKLLQAVAQLQATLGTQDIGQLFYRPLRDSQGTLVISTVCCLSFHKSFSSVNCKWQPVGKFQQKKGLSSGSDGDNMSAMELLINSIQEQIEYHQSSSMPLARGLYVCYLKMKSSVDLMRILVPKASPNILPFVKVRDNPCVSREEYQRILFLQQLMCSRISSNALTSDDPDEAAENLQPEGNRITECQVNFERHLMLALSELFKAVEVDQDMAKYHRIYHNEIIELTADISLLLVLPPAETVCTIPGENEPLSSNPDFFMLPLQIFETILTRTYQSELISKYSRLSALLEMDQILAQHAHREAFSCSELNEAKQRVNKLGDLQSLLDSTWRSCRWIMDVVSAARDKSLPAGVSVDLLQKDLTSNLMKEVADGRSSRSTTRSTSSVSSVSNDLRKPVTKRMLKMKSDNRLCSTSEKIRSSELAPQKLGLVRNLSEQQIACPECSIPYSLPGYVSNCSFCKCNRSLKQETELTRVISRSENQLNANCLSTSDQPRDDLFYNSVALSDSAYGNMHPSMYPKYTQRSDLTAQSVNSLNLSQDHDNLSVKSSDSCAKSNSTDSQQGENERDEDCVIQVYAAYDTGLASGTSVKLHITPKTSAREIIDLVVKQLNMAVVMKGRTGPVYSNDQLRSFCLVAVVGARERCFRDDFRPTTLTNPWKKGRLYVRMKKDLLAAIEQNTRVKQNAILNQ